MKKELFAAITSAITIGAVGTTFAAANPFVDVPKDHWSYDAVANLAQDGVVDGYGDNTFRGDVQITRYEMAQIVAKAMGKEASLNDEQKAVVEKLVAEYAAEMENNLGMRLSAVEKKTDNVIFNGMFRLQNKRFDKGGVQGATSSIGVLRLEPKIKIDDQWMVKGRIDAVSDFRKSDDPDDSGLKIVRAYAEGPLLGANAKIGRTYFTDKSSNGLVIDTQFSGVQLNYGGKIKTVLNIGRIDGSDYLGYKYDPKGNDVVDYQSAEVTYDEDKWGVGLGYHNVRKDTATFATRNNNSIWAAGMHYNINDNLKFSAAYSKSMLDLDAAHKVGKNDIGTGDGNLIKLKYKGVRRTDPGSLGAWVSYSKQNRPAIINPTTEGITDGLKGYEVGFEYMFRKNLAGYFIFTDGEFTGGGSNGTDFQRYWSRIEYRF